MTHSGRGSCPKEKEKEMSLSRKLLESLGLESDKVSTIIEAHAETVDALKSQIETYKADAEKYEATKKELNTAQIELESLKSTGGDWQSKYEAEHNAFEEFKNTQNAKDIRMQKESAYRQLLKESGISDKRLDSIMKVTDLDAIELEDGKIKDAEALGEAIKSEWSDFIVNEGTVGAKTDKPPVNNPITQFSHEDIAKMSADEINANWESIKESMKN